MVTRDTSIQLIVKKLQPEQPGYRSIIFERPRNFTFEAGDWVDLQFEGRSLRGGITYSISSAPTEPDIMITFRDGLSEFKHALQSVAAGDTVTIMQYGNDYDFTIQRQRSSVLIAGGVGIAPFRSMLKAMYDNGDTTQVTLLYMNRDDAFLFKSELDRWAERLSGVSIEYIVTAELNRKKREKIILGHCSNTAQNFYISGPPSMVDSNEHLLIDAGVPVRNIRIDIFGGY